MGRSAFTMIRVRPRGSVAGLAPFATYYRQAEAQPSLPPGKTIETFDDAQVKAIHELYFSVGPVIKDIDRLKALYEMFAETLQTLCEMGSAYDHDPGVRL